MAGTSTESAPHGRGERAHGARCPASARRPVVGGRSLAKAARTRAYVAALQRDLNRHLISLGSPTVLAVDGLWDRDTDVAFRPRLPRARPRARAHACARSARSGAPRAADRGGARAAPRTARPTRRSCATTSRTRRVPKPKPKPRTRSRRAHDAARAALRAAGARYEDAIVREARRYGVPVSLVCAVLEVETGFQNVFGHDDVRNPVKSPPRGLLAVTAGALQAVPAASAARASATRASARCS